MPKSTMLTIVWKTDVKMVVPPGVPATSTTLMPSGPRSTTAWRCSIRPTARAMHRDERSCGVGVMSNSHKGQTELMEEQSQGDRPALRDAMWRGLRGVCPSCGKSKLYATYLKQVERCPRCHVALGHLRSDDAAPWLTILIVGHIVVPQHAAELICERRHQASDGEDLPSPVNRNSRTSPPGTTSRSTATRSTGRRWARATARPGSSASSSRRSTTGG